MTRTVVFRLVAAALVGACAQTVIANPPHSPAILANPPHSPAILANPTEGVPPVWRGYVATGEPAGLFAAPVLRLPSPTALVETHRIVRLPTAHVVHAVPPANVPHEAWWSPGVAEPQRHDGPAVPLTLDQLAVEAVRYSQQVQALRVLPEISETDILQAAAEFDPLAFIDTRWYDRDEPVGSFLTTGGGPRLLEETQTNNIGLRQKTLSGGRLEVAQQIGLQDSNSTFFTPTNQAQTRLAISLRQPLLRGSGEAYNTSVIVLAEHATRIAADQFAEGLQDHLLEVARQYWQLYYQRALVLQKERNLGRARTILAELESRRAIDALRSQIARAQAKVATREADLARARAGVRNAEARLRSLVGSPQLACHPCLEIVPVDAPLAQHVPTEICWARHTALEHRPEIDNLLQQIKAVSVRSQVAENQLLPSLALVLEGYVNGLTSDYAATRSLGQQFTEGAPSYTAGLALEVPLGNRRAQAELRKRQLQLVQLTHELNAATAELAAEVEIALREVDVAHIEFTSQMSALEATKAEVEYLDQRWRLLPGDEQSTSFLLEDLLDAEDRLVDEEQQAAAAQVRLAVADAELKRALGTLVVHAHGPSPMVQPAPPMMHGPMPEQEFVPGPVGGPVMKDVSLPLPTSASDEPPQARMLPPVFVQGSSQQPPTIPPSPQFIPQRPNEPPAPTAGLFTAPSR